MKAKSVTLLVALLVAVFVAGVNGAYADTVLTLRVSDGTNPSVTIVDNGPGDLSPTDGRILWEGVVGEWDILTEVGHGTPDIGLGSMDLVFDAGSREGTSTALTVELTQTGTTPSFPGWILNIGGTVTGDIDPVTYGAWYDNGDVAFEQDTQIGSTLSFSGGGAFSGSIAGAASTDSLYSLTQVVTFQGTGGFGQATGDASLNPVPEPTAILLLGSGLVGVALLVRRKRS